MKVVLVVAAGKGAVVENEGANGAADDQENHAPEKNQNLTATYCTKFKSKIKILFQPFVFERVKAKFHQSLSPLWQPGKMKKMKSNGRSKCMSLKVHVSVLTEDNNDIHLMKGRQSHTAVSTVMDKKFNKKACP